MRLTRHSFTICFPGAQYQSYASSRGNITIKQSLENWLKDVKRTHPNSTHRCYKKSCQAHLAPEFGDYRVRDLSAQVIREWIRNRTSTLKSIHNGLTPLRAVLDQAFNDGIIDWNPLDKIKISKMYPALRLLPVICRFPDKDSATVPAYWAAAQTA